MKDHIHMRRNNSGHDSHMNPQDSDRYLKIGDYDFMPSASFSDEMIKKIREEMESICWAPDNTSVSVANKASRITNWPSIVINAWEFIKTQKKHTVIVDHWVVKSIPKHVIVKAHFNYYRTGGAMIYIMKDEEYFEPEIFMEMPLNAVFNMSKY